MRNNMLLLIAASITLGACATTTIDEPTPVAVETKPAAPSPDVGLALYEPRSDVADLTNAVRHVLNPADTYGASVSHVALEVRTQPANFDSPQAPVERVTAPVAVAQLDKVQDPVYEAWRKYCNNAEDITQREWGLIDRSDMPEELAAIWAEECIPLK